jgi:hypothetical protein
MPSWGMREVRLVTTLSTGAPLREAEGGEEGLWGLPWPLQPGVPDSNPTYAPPSRRRLSRRDFQSDDRCRPMDRAVDWVTTWPAPRGGGLKGGTE